MTHIGKIGRLSKTRRHELALRIEDGQTGAQIVQWLNAQPDVQEILQQHFAARPITEQNLSDWKQTGHLEWRRRQEASEAATRLVEQAGDLDQAVEDRLLSDEFATVFSSEMTRLAMTLLEQETDPEKRWKRLCEIHRELSQLRRDDHRAIRTSIREQRYRREVEREEEQEIERLKQAHKERLTEMLLAGGERKTNADLIFGGGESGRNKAEMLYRLRCDLPMEDLLDGTWAEKAGPVPAKAKPGVGTACPQNPAPSPAPKKTGPPPGPAQTPVKPENSSLLKANPAKKTTGLTKLKTTKCKSDQRRTHPRTAAQPAEPIGKPSCKPHRATPIRHSSSVIPPLNPIIPISATNPADMPQLTPEQMRVEEENRLWRIQNHFEDPPTPEPAKET
jgi:hypothetical protein